MPKSKQDILDQMESLAKLALPENNGAPDERDNAIRALANAIVKNKALLADPMPSRRAYAEPRREEPAWEAAPPKPTASSKVHEKAERAREWQGFRKQHDLINTVDEAPPDPDADDDFCNACGEPSKAGDDLVVHTRGLGWTHKRCAGWWWNVDFSEVEKPREASAPADDFGPGGGGDDEIPF